MVDRGAVTADFNNYLLPGIYRFNGEPSILNSPGSVAGNLEVIVTTGYVIQRITVYDRTYTDDTTGRYGLIGPVTLQMPIMKRKPSPTHMDW